PTTLDDLVVVVGDVEDDDLVVRWFRDGSPVDALDDTLAVPAADTTKGDVWSVSVSVTDGEETGPAADADVTVVNSAPVATDVALPAEAFETTEVVAVPSSTDADDDTVGWTYAWFVNGAMVPVVTGDTLTGDFFDRGDVVTVEATPDDGEDEGAAATSAELEVANSRPTYADATVSPDEVFEDSLVSCLGTGFADVDGDPEGAVVEWTVNGGPAIVSAVLTGNDFAKGDVLECTLFAFDGTDTSANPVVAPTVTVRNTLPTLMSVVIDTTAPNAAQDVTATPVGLTDLDGDATTLAWSWMINGQPVSTDPALPARTFARGDTLTVTVAPSDDEGAGAAVTSNPVTAVNAPPQATSVAITPANPATDEPLAAIVTREDVDGDPVTLAFQWFVDGQPAGNGPTLDAAAFGRDQVVRLEVTPNDGFVDGLTAVSAPITVRNSAPQVASVAIDPAPAFEASTLTCVPSGYADLDGDLEGYTWRWLVGGLEVATTQTLTGAAFDREDVVVCAATPFDGTDPGDEVASAPVIIANTPPTLAGASIDPTIALEGSTLVATPGTAQDDDGDGPITFSYEWRIFGNPVATGDTLDGAFFDKGDVVTVAVTPNDGTDDGAAVISNTVIISNTAPRVDSVTLTPTDLFTDTALTATPQGSDDDGDALIYSYTWFLQDEGVGGFVALPATGAVLPASAFDKDDQIYVEVTANDGDDDSPVLASATVTVQNSVPSAGSVAVDPAVAFETSTLTCVPSGWSDADGDPEGYTWRWLVQGLEVATTPTLSGADFDRGQAVTCAATPFDGEASSPELVSAPVMIANSPPVLASVSIDPSSAFEGSTLTAVLAGAQDADGDTISFSYAWTIGGSPVGAASTLTGASFDKGDLVVVTVTP
ncbi:MAG: hypothetical protein AAF211_21565, partial [Myxococcota bacterium]